MKKTGVIIELENGKIKDSNLGMITLARSENRELYAILTDGDIKSVKEDLESYGISKIINVSLEQNKANNPVIKGKAIVGAIRYFHISMVFGLSTSLGKDLLPRIAAMLDAPLVMDCFHVDPVKNLAKTSQYSGKTIATIKVLGDVCIFGVRANAVEPSKAPVLANMIEFDGSDQDSKGFNVVKTGDSGKGKNNDLAEADVIVAGGRGLSNGDNFKTLSLCAEKLNASVGASRVAVDSGWVPYSMQVGQTGEKVSPSVYIACGISGSMQHYAGMKTSGMVIAINTDEKASIISNCDYYAVADSMLIIEEMIKLLGNG